MNNIILIAAGTIIGFILFLILLGLKIWNAFVRSLIPTEEEVERLIEEEKEIE